MAQELLQEQEEPQVTPQECPSLPGLLADAGVGGPSSPGATSPAHPSSEHSDPAHLSSEHSDPLTQGHPISNRGG